MNIDIMPTTRPDPIILAGGARSWTIGRRAAATLAMEKLHEVATLPAGVTLRIGGCLSDLPQWGSPHVCILQGGQEVGHIPVVDHHRGWVQGALYRVIVCAAQMDIPNPDIAAALLAVGIRSERSLLAASRALLSPAA